jgi:hypothetical protein
MHGGRKHGIEICGVESSRKPRHIRRRNRVALDNRCVVLLHSEFTPTSKAIPVQA